MHDELLGDMVHYFKTGGFWANLMNLGSDYNRVKVFFHRIEKAVSNKLVRYHASYKFPILPLFPGLRNIPFHNPNKFKWTKKIERNYNVIKNEFDMFYHSKIDKTIQLVPNDVLDVDKNQKYDSLLEGGKWNVIPLFFMGENLKEFTVFFPKTYELITEIQRNSFSYPWGHAVFSNLSPGTHLKPHCSLDNLKIRCHFGIHTETSCQIRVKNCYRTWEDGKFMIFEDCFEHEVWHKGILDRVVLIIDMWHPNLTNIEIEVLTAAFRKSEIRRMIYKTRSNPLGNSSQIHQEFIDRFQREENQDHIIQKYWN